MRATDKLRARVRAVLSRFLRGPGGWNGCHETAIGRKLGLPFSFRVAISIGVGWLAFTPFTRMVRINADLEEIIDKRSAKVQLAQEALNYSSLNNRVTMQIFLLKSREEIDPLFARREHRKDLRSCRQDEQRVESEKEKELLAAVK